MSDTPVKPAEQAGESKPTHNLVQFPPISAEEKQRRLMVEVYRLADLAELDWTFQLKSRAAYFTEQFGVSPADMRALILARLKDIAKAKTEARRIEQRAEKKKQITDKAKQGDETAKRKAKIEADKREAAAKQAGKKEAERQRRKKEKEIERRAKQKAKAFGNIMRLPVDRHEKELQRLAKRLDEDATTLRDEFKEFLGVGIDLSTEKTEPWDEPVNIAARCKSAATRFPATSFSNSIS